MIAERPFQYVPAGITSTPGSYLAVKYEDNSNNPNLWSRIRFAGVTKAIYPDRTLYEGTCTRRSLGIGSVDFDAILPVSPSSNPELLENAGFRYGMASPVHTSKDAETRRNKHAKIFSDSGGFQLLTGALDFIDPYDLAEYYNRAVDLGIGLDVPVFGNNDLLLTMAEILLKNNRILRRELKPAVTLYEVSHGATLKTRKAFLDRILKEKDLSPALAVGGIAQNYKDGGVSRTIVTGALNLMYVLSTTRRIFRQYHILGTTSPLFQAMYWLVQHHGLVTHITADSTTWVQQPINNLIILDDLSSRSVRVATTSIPKDLNTRVLPCSCPSCYLAKYPIAYTWSAKLNQVHSLYSLAATYTRVEELVSDYYAGSLSLQELARLVTSSPAQASVAVAVFKFCIDVATSSFKAAYEKHYSTLSSLSRKTRASLFEAKASGADPETRKRLITVLEKYDTYHKKRK